MATPSHPARDLAWLLLAAFVVIAAGLGLRDPWPADEPRFALVTRQILEAGDWLFLRRGDELYSDKPPVFMWVQAAAITFAGGSLRLGFLLPSLLASLGTLWLVYDLGRRLWTHRVGLAAAWLLLFALQFTFQAKRAQIDPLLLFLVTLANYGVLRQLLLGPDPRAWGLGGFAAGLGTITKAVGGLALLMVLPAAWAAWRRWPCVTMPRPRTWALGALLFALATLPWLGPLAWAVLGSDDPVHREYAHTLLFHQTVNRYADSWDHEEPFWYQFGVVATLWLPAALALPWAVPAWWRRLRRRDARYLLPLAWVAMVLLFFSVPEGKRDVYILPALPMFCLALAPLAPGLLRKAGLRRLLLAFALGLGGVLLVAGLAMLLGEPGFERRLLGSRGYTPEDARWLAGVLALIGGWMLGCTAVLRARPAAAVGWALGGLWVVYSLGAYPVLDRYLSARGVMAEVARHVGPDAELGGVAWRETHLLVADRRVATFGFGPSGNEPGASWPEQWRKAAAWQAEKPETRWIFALEQAMPACVDRDAAHFAGTTSGRRWWLLPVAAVPPGCGAGAVAAPSG
jgi:4-amino-4-deoxy-L-arabinose transferase-like glycosyltransferase